MILGILGFALVTAILYVWGLRRSMTQGADLERILLSKSAGKVVHYLKGHDQIDLAQMARLCAGVKAGQFWSRRRVAGEDSRAFISAQDILGRENRRHPQQLLEELSGGRYRLKP